MLKSSFSIEVSGSKARVGSGGSWIVGWTSKKSQSLCEKEILRLQ
jgi:hypothetical protein